MKTLHYAVDIAAPRIGVWQTLISPETYGLWTAPFCEGSRFEGAWDEGERIRFLSPDGSGMVALVVTNRLHEFISLRHLGEIVAGVDQIDSDETKALAYAQSFENYSFSDIEGGTRVEVAMTVPPEWEGFMAETWPRALERLKAICESPQTAGTAAPPP